MMSKHAKKTKRRSSRKLRQMRLLILICLTAGMLYYWGPITAAVQVWIPAGKQDAARSAALGLPAQETEVTVQKGTIFMLADHALKALKSDRSLLWSKELKDPAQSVIPSYDGVFVQSEDAEKLLRYSFLGKLMGEVPVPGPFSQVYESVNGILFENRSLRQYTWTDSSGKVLGTQVVQEEHILKTTVDTDSGDTVVATLKTDGGTLESTLHRFDSSGRLTGARTFRDAVLLNMQFMNSRLIVVLDDRMISLDQQMKDHWVVREPARYQAVSYGPENFWVDRVQTGAQDNQVLQCYNQDGKVLFSLPFKGELTLMAAGEGHQVAAVSGQRLQIYSEKGILNSEIQLTKVPEKIVWLNAKHLLIFYGDSVSTESIDKRNPL